MTPSFAVRQSGPPFFLTQASGAHPVWMCPRCFSLLRSIRPAEAAGSHHHLIWFAFHPLALASQAARFDFPPPENFSDCVTNPQNCRIFRFFIVFSGSTRLTRPFLCAFPPDFRRLESNSISSLSVPFQSLSEERFFRTFRQKSRSIVKKAVIFQVESNVFVCYTEIDSTIRKSFH